MSEIECPNCGSTYNGEKAASCPSCLSSAWLYCPTFIREKHDPMLLPYPWPSFRSVLSYDFVKDQEPFIDYAAHNGGWYFSPKDHDYCHVTDMPLASIPGSGVAKNAPMPFAGYEMLVVAKPTTDPHGYAASSVEFSQAVKSGVYQKLPRCKCLLCRNLAAPFSARCNKHSVSISDRMRNWLAKIKKVR
jgi:hypothetical protein